MRNFLKVFLLNRKRIDFDIFSMTEIRAKKIGYIDTIFYILADAKMDGINVCTSLLHYEDNLHV